MLEKVFYTNVLGLEQRVENPTPGGPRFLTVGLKGDDFQLALWPRREPAPDPRGACLIVNVEGATSAA